MVAFTQSISEIVCQQRKENLSSVIYLQLLPLCRCIFKLWAFFQINTRVKVATEKSNNKIINLTQAMYSQMIKLKGKQNSLFTSITTTPALLSLPKQEDSQMKSFFATRNSWSITTHYKNFTLTLLNLISLQAYFL